MQGATKNEDRDGDWAIFLHTATSRQQTDEVSYST